MSLLLLTLAPGGLVIVTGLGVAAYVEYLSRRQGYVMRMGRVRKCR